MRLIKVFLIITILFLSACKTQKISSLNYETSKAQITTMLLQTAEDWSKGDLEAFMQGYLKSDSLKFVGSSGITYGWQQTLDNYRKGYPSKDHTGTLTFNLLEFDQLSSDVFLVIGEFHLIRVVGDADGMFSIILKHVNGEWKIIADHSS